MIHVTSSMFMKNGGTCRALDATGDGDEKHRKHTTTPQCAEKRAVSPLAAERQNTEVSEKSERKTPPRAPAPLISYNSLDCAGRTRSSNVQPS